MIYFPKPVLFHIFVDAESLVQSSFSGSNQVCLSYPNLVQTFKNAKEHGLKITSIKSPKGQIASFRVTFFGETLDFFNKDQISLDFFEKYATTLSLQKHYNSFRSLLSEHFPLSLRDRTFQEIGAKIYKYSGILEKTWKPTYSVAGRMIRESVIGGRTEIIRWKDEHIDAVNYDIKGAYAMFGKEYIPIGAPTYIRHERLLHKNDLALIHCRLKIPNRHIGIVPTRGRFGTFYGVDGLIDVLLWKNEINFALSLGCEIKEFHSALVFNSDNVLAETIEKLEKIKEKHPEFKKDTKFIINQIIGLSAVKNEKNKYVFDPKSSLGYVLVDEEHGLCHKKTSSPLELPIARPQIFSLIASKTRVELGHIIESTNTSELLAYHTDGIMIRGDQPLLNKVPYLAKKAEHKDVNWFAPFNGAYVVWNSQETHAKGPIYGEKLRYNERIVRVSHSVQNEYALESTHLIHSPTFKNRKPLDGGYTEPIRFSC